MQENEAREIAYHFIRVNLGDKSRPGRLEKARQDGYEEPVWEAELIGRSDGERHGKLVIGMETGSIHAWQAVEKASPD